MTERYANDHPESAAYAIILGFIVPLALGALLSDWRFALTYEIQWLNFADWLVAGSLVGGGIALAWALIRTTLAGRWSYRPAAIAVLLLAAFMVMQFVNALIHSKDNFATMPGGLILSIITTILAIAAAWTGLRTDRRGIVQ
ncbi:hypothetical protein H8M03_07355 [Sphingomonas sabuli]|uniref:DUF2231 domain-containing protein n=1 Tax=Sphingomonas sabuli TaxID=2764186 RepID=A0A7G9KZS0_9SPHN|nr:hypothetical protein [Sphingomonas sabuli]QNM81869.1 hypothetical protein H8M03_07355 [Sphingomonas sabuli]